MHDLLKAAVLDSEGQTVEKASFRQIVNRARKLPSALRLKSTGLRYGQRVSVNDDPDERKVGRALDFKRVKTGGPYRNHPDLIAPRVEVSAGRNQSLFAQRKTVRPVRF